MKARWAALGFGCVLCAVGVYRDLAPGAIFFMLGESMALLYAAQTFARSLASTPFITRIAMRAKGRTLRPDEHDYTRDLTEIWVGILIALAVTNLLVALAPRGTYGWGERAALDVLPLAFFFVEHVYRRLRFARIWEMPPLRVVIAAVISERYHWVAKDRP
ncbi:MAG: hypothetical protein M0Z44_06875 [Gammaproteobacteria bacterium]|nr:hypothetical protein [Gammaproteobacteria bacterium]